MRRRQLFLVRETRSLEAMVRGCHQDLLLKTGQLSILWCNRRVIDKLVKGKSGRAAFQSGHQVDPELRIEVCLFFLDSNYPHSASSLWQQVMARVNKRVCE